jgi:hypothetical protein
MGVLFRDMGVGGSLFFQKSYGWGLYVFHFRVIVEPVPQKIPFCGPFEAHAMGGRATAKKLTKKQRQANARKAIAARWAKRKQAA